MTRTATVFGGMLILLGLVAYFGTGRESLTALIPTLFGLLFVLCGWIGAAESRRMHAMHAAALLALLGIGGSFRGIPSTIRLLGGAELERPEAAVAQALMALLCGVFLLLAIRSFVEARRARKAADV